MKDVNVCTQCGLTSGEAPHVRQPIHQRLVSQIAAERARSTELQALVMDGVQELEHIAEDDGVKRWPPTSAARSMARRIRRDLAALSQSPTEKT